MNTPVVDFIKKYSESCTVRLHVPGHKGKGEAFSSFDITEIKGADVLYHEDGILGESQKNASSLFGTANTFYSAEGSSLSIRAMAALVKMYAESKGIKPVIAAGRNAHKVFMTVTALLDIEVRWICPEKTETFVSARFSPDYLEDFLNSQEELPAAVYVTSPDYLGNIADIKSFSEVCRKKGVLLICDNAHGAYLRFLDEDMHPITQGADLCCDSAHKTLPVLTGGGYLHVSKKAPRILLEKAKDALALFASTSPSYLILQSLDRFNGGWEEYKNELNVTVMQLNALKSRLVEAGYCLCGNEPLKLTIDTKEYGYTGDEFSDILRENGFECEFSDADYVVMMFTPFITKNEVIRLSDVLLSIDKRERINGFVPVISPLKKVFSVKEAMFMLSENISVDVAVGRILASVSVSCPPAIPVAICGEELNENAVRLFKYYGIDRINVIKQ